MGFLKSIFKEKDKETEIDTSVYNEKKIDSKINLRKETINKICLEKKELVDLTCKVVVVMDYSISMSRMYKDGTVQNILERMLPLGLRFDDDGKVETWLFHDSFYKIKDLSLNNYENYIDNEKIMEKYNMGGTKYCPIIKEIVNNSKKDTAPVYVIFITDGDNTDKEDTSNFMIKASKYPVFFQFIGIGKGPFNYLEKLDNLKGRFIDNAAFFNAVDINKMSDDMLYKEMLKEYPRWLNKAKIEKIIK